MKELKIGDKINNWTIIGGPYNENTKKEYDLQCTCGKINRYSYRYIIKSSFSKSCRSCSQKLRRLEKGEYKEGDKIKNLTILNHRYQYKGNTYFKVRCDCGNVFYTGHSKLYGLKIGKSLPYCKACYSVDKKAHKKSTMVSEHLSVAVFNHIHKQAKERGIYFNLSPEYLEQLLINQNFKCSLSGLPLSLSLGFSTPKDRQFHTASLDRIDSSIGYVEGNVQWVHKIINYMKGTLTQEEFINYCKCVSNLHANQQPSVEYTP